MDLAQTFPAVCAKPRNSIQPAAQKGGTGGAGFSAIGEVGADSVLTHADAAAEANATPSQSARSADRGSFTTSEVVSKRIVALRVRSYFGQPQSPLVANATHAACMVSASCCGGSVPQRGSVSLPRVSNTKGISSEWHAPRSPLNCRERQANSYIYVAAVLLAWASARRRVGMRQYQSVWIAASRSPALAPGWAAR
jgi:hypothetical protein